MNKYELEHILGDARDALNGIVGGAERFAQENFGVEIFSLGGRWSDACGERISVALVDSVERAVRDNLNLYECESVLQNMADDISPLLAVIEQAKQELQ